MLGTKQRGGIYSIISKAHLIMNLYKLDRKRYVGSGIRHELRFLYWFRMAQSSTNIAIKSLARLMLNHYRKRYGLEIPRQASIGPGLYIGHAYNITINADAIIGQNCNIHKGIVIGMTNRGKTKGVPVIGNEVWIGINAAIVGGITIGDDVLIAPNSFVNCDIPSHSVVFGNPCVTMIR